MSEASVYRIRLRGELGPGWSNWFQGVRVDNCGDGTSCLTGHLADQAALFGLLARVRDLGLEIVSVETAFRASSEGETGDGSPAARELERCGREGEKR